eukprot:6415217-Prymnesium_polylepis.1
MAPLGAAQRPAPFVCPLMRKSRFSPPSMEVEDEVGEQEIGRRHGDGQRSPRSCNPRPRRRPGT